MCVGVYHICTIHSNSNDNELLKNSVIGQCCWTICETIVPVSNIFETTSHTHDPLKRKRKAKEEEEEERGWGRRRRRGLQVHSEAGSKDARLVSVK